MKKPTIAKSTVETTSAADAAPRRAASQETLAELPETPGLRLPAGKITTATRGRLMPFSNSREDE